MMRTPPFFIVGCGRSGTTLLRTMLNSHPEVAVPLESLFIADYLKVPARMASIMKLCPKEFEIREWGIQISSSQLSDCSDPASLIRRLHETYANSHSKQYWGQKTPRLVRCWRIIHDAFPDARFIHVVRDPRATVASLVRSNVHRSTTYYAVRRWNGDVGHGLAMERALDGRVLRVRYEDLVHAPTDVLARVCRFLGVEYSERMMSTEGKLGEYAAYYSEIHAKLGDAPDAGRADLWKEELNPWQVRYVEAQSQELMRELGYRPYAGPGARTTLPAALSRFSRWVRLPMQLWHYLRYRRGYVYSMVRRKWALGLWRDFIGING